MHIGEYIWIDADGGIRSKIKVVPPHQISQPDEADCWPIWSYDGSSTDQAPSDRSDVILYPRRVFWDRTWDRYLVLCETSWDGDTRRVAERVFRKYASEKPWFGIEQEYVIYDDKTGRLLGWPKEGPPPPQGPYYCGIDGGLWGRELAEEHMNHCLAAGLTISGINAEVMPGQWEYQVGPCEGIESAYQMIISRFLLHRLAEKNGLWVSLDPKPVEEGSWNGSGAHINFSTEKTRSSDIGSSREIFKVWCENLQKTHVETMKCYGAGNERRMTGAHETSSFHNFTWGESDRTASVRIPPTCDRIEDRRPAANIDPYLATAHLTEVCLSKVCLEDESPPVHGESQ